MEHQVSLSVPLFLSLVDLTPLSHLLKKKGGRRRNKKDIILINTWISQNKTDLEH